ncbi:MAG: NADP-dependent oxidoreductase [Bacteroidia bacterium]|nr:NADP-dependent oxidoreductase [Bacteroidia bacterium]
MENRQYLLAKRPVGQPQRSDFEYRTGPAPDPGPDEVLVRNRYISLDPAMRGWMNDARSYIRPVQIGEVMRAGTAGEVIASNSPLFAPGDFVYGSGGVQDYYTAQARHLQRIDPQLAPLPVYLGTLGMPGMTAYFGLTEVGQAKAGETVVISAASGAVGSVAGQIAKQLGCRTIGITGGEAKCRYITETLGFDAAVDYQAGSLRDQLKAACPDGIDVYFDNTGGEILDTVLTRLRMKARIAVCGAITQYNSTEKTAGPSNYLSLLVNRARMEGFVVFDYAPRYPEALARMIPWYQEGKLLSREEIVPGLETFPETLLRLFTGDKTGKLVLAV